MNFQNIQSLWYSTVIPCRNRWQYLHALGEFIHLENPLTTHVVWRAAIGLYTEILAKSQRWIASLVYKQSSIILI